MGPIYGLETELRELCNNTQEVLQTDALIQEKIYYKIIELVTKLMYRNPSKFGKDVDLNSIPHEVAADIMPRILKGRIKIYKWSGYIMTILPRIIKNNASINGPEIIDPYAYNIDPKNIMDMSHSGSISYMRSFEKKLAEYNLTKVPEVIDAWMKDEIKYLEDPRDYQNLKISIMLSFIKDEIVLFRLYDYYRTKVVFYFNKLRLYLSTLLVKDPGENVYDQISRINEYELLERNCNND